MRRGRERKKAPGAGYTHTQVQVPSRTSRQTVSRSSEAGLAGVCLSRGDGLISVRPPIEAGFLDLALKLQIGPSPDGGHPERCHTFLGIRGARGKPCWLALAGIDGFCGRLADG